MPLINNPTNPLTASLNEFTAPLNGLFGDKPKYVGADFKEGFLITPYDSAGFPDTANAVALMGSFMPKQPFSYGGKQSIVKEYYAGNPEAAVQIMGSRENDLVIKGKFKVKKFSSASLTNGQDPRLIPLAMQERLDEIRLSGMMVKLQLGEWVRFGWIEETNFNMMTKADIDYEIKFFIVGFVEPQNCKVVDTGFPELSQENSALVKAALNFQSLAVNEPGNIPATLGQTINTLIGTVASAVSVVTKFVDQVISIGEGAEKLANRGIGLVRYARVTISSFKSRVGALDPYELNSSADAATRALDKVANAKYITDIQTGTEKVPAYISPAMKASVESNLSNYTSAAATQSEALKQNPPSVEEMLVRIERQFVSIARKVPRATYTIKDNDTLQTLSLKFYGTADNWKALYDHNKLSSTVLIPDTTLEIPSL